MPAPTPTHSMAAPSMGICENPPTCTQAQGCSPPCLAPRPRVAAAKLEHTAERPTASSPSVRPCPSSSTLAAEEELVAPLAAPPASVMRLSIPRAPPAQAARRSARPGRSTERKSASTALAAGVSCLEIDQQICTARLAMAIPDAEHSLSGELPSQMTAPTTISTTACLVASTSTLLPPVSSSQLMHSACSTSITTGDSGCSIVTRACSRVRASTVPCSASAAPTALGAMWITLFRLMRARWEARLSASRAPRIPFSSAWWGRGGFC